MSAIRLGVSSYTFVWAVGVPGYPQPAQPLTAAALLDKAAMLGVKVVQIADNLPLDRLSTVELDRLAEQAVRLGIQIEVGTCGIDPDHLRNYLSLAMRFSSPLVRVVIDTDRSQPSPDEVAATLREVLTAYARAGVKLAIENHDRFPARVLAEIIERCGEGIGICLDTANSLGCGEDVQTVLRALKKHVLNLHVKDFSVSRLPHKKGFVVEGCPAGRGVLDIPSLIGELGSLGGEMSTILELWPAPEPSLDESMAKEDAWTRESIDYLRQFITD